jgi:hypothetical protein
MHNQPDAIAVFSSKDLDTILRIGGTQSWVLNLNRTKNIKYVVIFSHGGGAQGAQKANHGRAWLIGEIERVEPADGERRPQRWRIVFKNYALLDSAAEWPGFRNPVTYMSLESLGINPAALDFKPIPKIAHVQKAVTTDPPSRRQGQAQAPLTIQQAKDGLAAHFGVSPDAIEIIIRG